MVPGGRVPKERPMKSPVTLALLIFTLTQPLSASKVSTKNFLDGDLIFIDSTSAQSPALKEATGSKWTHVGILFKSQQRWKVYEAAGKVRVTSFVNFLKRSRGGAFVVKRPKANFLRWDNEARSKLKTALKAFFGKPYDIFFEWSDQAIYCSELVWKAFFQAFGKAPGVVQKFGDLKLDGPEIQKLIERRIKPAGKVVNLEEPIITPVSIFEDPDLFTVSVAEAQ
jgi:hypothetical protein